MASSSDPAPTWESTTASKRTALSSLIPPSWRVPSSLLTSLNESSPTSALHVPRESGILTESELAITENHDATDLLALMASGTLTSLAVVTAFCKRAAIAQQCVNCLTEIMFDAALARARECDEYLATHGRVMGPLHGLPISLKDSFNVKGVQSTIGYASFLSNPSAGQNSVLVDILLAAGAVLHVKTNLPQTMMSADSHNFVFGRTLNPHKLSLTAGGSSGGECALLAMGGSVLGLGTDIGGSVRIPGLCCGVGAVKPTAARIPFAGKVPPGRLGSPGAIVPVIGPIGRSVRDFELLVKTVLDAGPWAMDENVLNVPWRAVVPVTRPLRFGLVLGCKERPLHPPIARALHEAARLLEAQGHAVVLIHDKVPDLYQSALLSWKFFLLDQTKVWLQYILASGEPIIPSLPGSTFPELEGWEPSLDGLFETNLEKAKVAKAWREVLVNEKLDAVLSAGYQATAVPHDTYGVPVYTVLQNLLNYPVGVLPFGKANKELDAPFVKADAAYVPPYNPEAVEGAPAHVQITGKPMMDEELMEVMKVVEGILKKGE